VINKVLTPDQPGAFPVVNFSGASGFGGIGGMVKTDTSAFIQRAHKGLTSIAASAAQALI
jgi:hypothetical protein